MIWDATALAELARLRETGLSQHKCARHFRCSNNAIFKALHPAQPKPKPEQPKPKTSLLPPRVLHGSCPMSRKITPALRSAQRAMRPLTKSEMRDILTTAVKNTARL